MPATEKQIVDVRRFNRFYTKQLGLLDEGLLATPFSLSEGRVMYEIAHQDDPTATSVATALGLDAGYMSRLVRGLTRRGFLEKSRSPADRRSVLLALTGSGRDAFDELTVASSAQVRALLERLGRTERGRVVDAMGTLERILGPDAQQDRRRYSLRPHRPGDIGWVVERHGILYARSHGWDGRFEAMCAEIGARFLENFDPAWERSWIAEIDGERVGAIFLVRRSKTIGQLRFLFVDPAARGLGLGSRLVSECVGHARHVGYRSMALFTVRDLDAARRLYEAEGFELTHEEPGEGWSEGHTVQRWDLKL